VPPAAPDLALVSCRGLQVALICQSESCCSLAVAARAQINSFPPPPFTADRYYQPTSGERKEECENCPVSIFTHSLSLVIISLLSQGHSRLDAVVKLRAQKRVRREEGVYAIIPAELEVLWCTTACGLATLLREVQILKRRAAGGGTDMEKQSDDPQVSSNRWGGGGAERESYESNYTKSAEVECRSRHDILSRAPLSTFNW